VSNGKIIRELWIGKKGNHRGLICGSLSSFAWIGRGNRGKTLVRIAVSPLKYEPGKVMRVTGHGGPYGCETSRLPHFLDNRLKDGGEVTPQEDSWYSFLLEAESTPGP
jgi:hypothetical protein